jgi:hypothetical protein
MSFKLRTDARSRMAGRFISRITREVRKAYEHEKHRRKLTQSALAQLLGVDRATVHRQIKVGGNLQLRTLSDYAWALDHELEVRLTPRLLNVGHGTNTAVASAPALSGSQPITRLDSASSVSATVTKSVTGTPLAAVGNTKVAVLTRTA